MEKLKMFVNDGVSDNIKKIASIFPNCITETVDAEGKSRLSIDFDKLQQELSEDAIEEKTEKYEFVWQPCAQ